MKSIRYPNTFIELKNGAIYETKETAPLTPRRSTLLMIIFKIFTRCVARPMLFRPGVSARTMAKAMTGSFYLTETVTIPAASLTGTRFQGTIDLGAYVNVPTGQCVAIESVDFIFQIGDDFGSDASKFLQANGAIGVQLTDLNPGTAFVRADDQSLIASGSINIDQTNNIATHVTDLFPDQWGPASLAHAFMVVNDTLYFNAGPDSATSNATTAMFCTVRIRCQVAKLNSSDWMSIAIQSTASDN